MKIKNFLMLVLWLALLTFVNAQQMPQDYWHEELKFGSAGTADGQFSFGGIQSGSKNGGLACATDGRLFVADTGNNRIQVFTEAGAFINKWGTGGSGNGQFDGPRGIAIGGNGLVYVADSGNNRIQVFQDNGVFLRSWPSASPTALGVNKETGVIYTTDNSARQVKAYHDDGTTGILTKSWGEPGILDGQFGNMRDMGLDLAGNIYVCCDDRRVQKFDQNGQFLKVKTDGGDQFMTSMFVTQEGVFGVGYGPYWGHGYDNNSLSIYDPSFAGITGWGYGSSETPAAMAISTTGHYLYVATIRGEIHRYDRTNRTIIPLSKRHPIPLPIVLNVQQRSGTTYLDIDFQVTDPDSASVQVAGLAFVDGGNTLNSLLKLNTFVEGTGSNLGLNIPSNARKRITWNAAADWSVNFGQIQVEILAKDEHGLLAFHWITLPASGADLAVTVSESPVSDADLLSIWYWLIATSDPSVRLQNGLIYGVGGSYDGQNLANSATTTAPGRQFLYSRLGVRSITTMELERALAGNYNFQSLSTNSVVKAP
jgi:DNA-binding beta-propeller fold protein YncE